MLSQQFLRAASRSSPRWAAQATRGFKSSARAFEEQAAHTPAGRIRQWQRSLPVEVYPLFAIMFSSLSFGIYSFVRPAIQDATLRLHRTKHV